MIEVMVFDTDKAAYIYKQSFKRLELDKLARELNTAFWTTAITEKDEPEAA